MGRSGSEEESPKSRPSRGQFRTAPTAARALKILELLAEDPETSYTQAELQRRLGFSHGNLHAILATMEATGHVRRGPFNRTYTLGPALLAIGESARRTYPIVEMARPVMERLAAELDTECNAAARVGDTLLIVARVGPLQPLGYGVSTGQRIPLMPPIGSSFISWSGDREIEAYLHSGADDLSDEELDSYRVAMAAVRRQGYSVHREAEPRHRLSERTARTVRDATTDDDLHELTVLSSELAHTGYLPTSGQAGTAAILNMSSPVFAPDGSVALSISVSFTSSSMADRLVPEVGDLLVAATKEVTRAIGGRPPANE